MNIDKERFLKLTEILSPEGDLIYFSRLEGGVSCDVFLLEVKEGTKINKFVVRTEGLPTSENTVETEFYLLKSISNKQVPTAEAFYFDNSCEILDKPFMVMSFLEGTIFEPKEREFSFLEIMAKQLIRIHQTDIAYLPELPLRTDPLDGLISYLPKESRWDELSSLIKGLNKEIFEGEKVFLHGDFWLGNLLWKDSLIVGILDWEYAAIGDPLSDLATACLEVRYEVGIEGIEIFKHTYSNFLDIDEYRLSLWLIFVASSTLHFIDEWKLPNKRKKKMIKEATLTIEEEFNKIKNYI
jgi:aminoglycoside phosphotransferase (APT) family kinase protein